MSLYEHSLKVYQATVLLILGLYYNKRSSSPLPHPHNHVQFLCVVSSVIYLLQSMNILFLNFKKNSIFFWLPTMEKIYISITTSIPIPTSLPGTPPSSSLILTTFFFKLSVRWGKGPRGLTIPELDFQVILLSTLALRNTSCLQFHTCIGTASTSVLPLLENEFCLFLLYFPAWNCADILVCLVFLLQPPGLFFCSTYWLIVPF